MDQQSRGPSSAQTQPFDASALLTGSKTPRNEFLYYTSRGDIEGLRQGKWKLLVKKPRKPRNAGKDWKPKQQVMLFDLSEDMGEQNNLADANPEVVENLKKRMIELDAEITENARAPWMKGN